MTKSPQALFYLYSKEVMLVLHAHSFDCFTMKQHDLSLTNIIQDFFFSRDRPRRSHASQQETQPPKGKIANVVIAKNLNLTQNQVQIQALEVKPTCPIVSLI
jgi:hypothetical protein